MANRKMFYMDKSGSLVGEMPGLGEIKIKDHRNLNFLFVPSAQSRRHAHPFILSRLITKSLSKLAKKGPNLGPVSLPRNSL